MDCHSADTGSNPVGTANERVLWDAWARSGETFEQLMVRVETKIEKQDKKLRKAGRMGLAGR